MERKNNKITDDGYWWVCFIPTNRLSVRLNSLTSLSSLCYVTCFCVYVVGIGFNWLKQKNLEKVTFLAIPRLMNLPGRIRSSFESAGVNWHCESAGEVAPKHWICAEAKAVGLFWEVELTRILVTYLERNFREPLKNN